MSHLYGIEKADCSSTHIISENMLNKLEGIVRDDFLKYNLHLFDGGSLQLLLDEPGAVLIAAEFHYGAEYLLPRITSVIKVTMKIFGRTINSHLRDLLDRNSSSRELRRVTGASTRS